MQRLPLIAFLILAGTRAGTAQDLLITEFLAQRSVSVLDDFRDPSDFIEIYNAGSTAVDLGGFFLSDDCDEPLKWTFEAGVVIEPGEFLVVWASEKDQRDPCCDLHTSFRLDGNGECVVLSDPFGDLLHLHPFYPEQVLGYSYGLAMAPDGLDRHTLQYFPTATPGVENVGGAPGVTEAPVFSEPSGAYPPGLVIGLSLEVPVSGTEIRFTLDETLPSESSPLYAGPIDVDSEVLIRARAFQPGLLPSEPVVGHYLVLGEDVLDLSSSVPLVVCSTLGQSIPSRCSHGPYTPGRFLIFIPGDDGRARLADEAHFAHRVGFRKRGNPAYTCGWPKFPFNVEFRDREDKDQDVQLFDFASHADFSMWGPYQIDRSFMRNPIAYWMSREIGHWAARTQFVECFLHTRGGELTMASYFGVYVLMERCKRGLGRIDVERLSPTDNEEPRITGAYILQRDRIKTGDVGISAGGYSSLVFTYPKNPTSAQRRYMADTINAMVASLNPDIGSQEDTDLIDFGSFLDHHILQWYAKNPDAFRFSGYFHKPRGGLFKMGPIWDFDRTYGADDVRVQSPDGFLNDPVWDLGSNFFVHPGGTWYGRLFGNQWPTGPQPWARAYRARWYELRAGPLSTANVSGRIDAWADILDEPAERNFARWSGYRPRFGSYRGEVEHLKNWLQTRAEWIDSVFIEPPSFSHPGGVVSPGFEVEISVLAGEIFYTLNGADPRGPDRSPDAEAIEYTGPIAITENTRVRARALVEGLWSNVSEVIFVTSETRLVVTEIMYDPGSLPGDGFGSTLYEFIEFHNAGTEPINLQGVTLESPRFEFTLESAVTTLDAGEYVVLVRSVDAFVERYGSDGILIGGQFSGALSNSTQNIRVIGSVSETLMDFDYHSSWHPSTSGGGHSLVIRSPTASLDRWNLEASWRPSLESEGSPGREDVELVQGLRLQGDLNGSGSLEISDAILLVLNLFGGRTAEPCETDEGNRILQDTDGDGVLTQNDALHLLHYLFLTGPPPAKGLECTPVLGCPDACG